MRLHCTKTSTPYKLPENTNKTQTRKNVFSFKLQFMSVFLKTRMNTWTNRYGMKK